LSRPWSARIALRPTLPRMPDILRRGRRVHIRPIRPADEAEFLREGLELVLRHALGDLRLHRVQASIQPCNARSIALVGSRLPPGGAGPAVPEDRRALARS
jgi:hypothetical protein